jgi:hypothetical protein
VVPGKVKVHVWRLVENGLAIGTELSRRKIKDGIVCLACGRTEDLVHRFWTCPHSASTWLYRRDQTDFSAPTPPKKLLCHAELKGWLLDWIGKAKADHLSWMFMVIYHLWLARNDARESKCIEDPKEIMMKAIAAVEEWRSLRNPSVTVTGRPTEHWLPPVEDWLKVNTDGVFKTADSNGGGGVVIRDHHGDFICGESHFLPTLLMLKAQN